MYIGFWGGHAAYDVFFGGGRRFGRSFQHPFECLFKISLHPSYWFDHDLDSLRLGSGLDLGTVFSAMSDSCPKSKTRVQSNHIGKEEQFMILHLFVGKTLWAMKSRKRGS